MKRKGEDEAGLTRLRWDLKRLTEGLVEVGLCELISVQKREEE